MTKDEQTIANLKKLKSVHNGSYGADIDRAIKALEQEPCTDTISRQAVIDMTGLSEWFDSSDSYNGFVIALSELPSVTPKQKTGKWFYDESIENWRCSECKETPKTMGYCGSVNFMVEHFKFCNHCGTKMENEDI
jgi:hypothetical protein